jgi:glycosyltransferase involved in cell wall biosynthesis
VIPAYNEAGRIPRLFREIEETLDLATTEIIVVDDGSRDATAHIAESFVAEIPHGQVIRLGTNSGKGSAVREGVVRTTGEIVMFMDADAATDLSCVEPLVTSLDHHDIAIGSRSHTDATVERAHRYRAYMGGAFNVMVRSVAGLPFRDTQCGFKAFRGGVARLLFSVSAVDGFAFDVEVLRLAQQLGFSTTEIPVTWTHQSGSKIRHLADPTRMLIDITRVRMQRSTRSVQTIRITTADSTEVMRELRAANSSLIISNRAGYTDIVVGSEAPQVREMVLDHLRESEIHHQEMVHELGDLRPAPRTLSRSASS